MPKKEFSLLGEFLSSYIEVRTDVKPLTTKKYKTTRRRLVDHFGESKKLSEVCPADAR